MKRKALGKGLDALLPPRRPSISGGLLQLDVSEIRPNPLQPRLNFAAAELDSLAHSIRENGIIQPLVLRRVEDHYELVVGERRWRAAQRAGIKQVPAIVQQFSDQKMLELALVENLQRQDLTAIEEAHAYQLLIEQFALSQEAVAQRVGKSRAAVANTLRLLRLPKSIQAMILEGHLSMGHARALLPLPSEASQINLAKQILKTGMSVREVERRVKRLVSQPDRSQKAPARTDPNLQAAISRLEEHCQTRIEIRQQGNSGRIILHYASSEELERIYELLLGE